MPMDQVAELARQVANDGGVLQALRQRSRANQQTAESKRAATACAHQCRVIFHVASSDDHQCAGTFARHPDRDHGRRIAVFPPKGKGSLPLGNSPSPAAAPHSVPRAAPIAGVPPRPTAPSSGGGQAPHSGAPTASAPQASTAPAAHTAPQASHTPNAPTATPRNWFYAGRTRRLRRNSAAAGNHPSVQRWSNLVFRRRPGLRSADWFDARYRSGVRSIAGQTLQSFRAPSVGVTAPGCCGASHIAMIAIVAQLSTTAQAGITAITAIAGLG